MRTINLKKDFAIGRKVEVVRTYTLGSIKIDIGRIGKIVGFQLLDLPDMMLWDIKVWDVDFDGEVISAAESIVKDYMRLV